jgi:hypothetical protein
MVLLVVAVGLAAGFGAVAFAAGSDGPRRRAAQPSVSRFRFPSAIGAATAAAVPPPPSLPGSGRAAVEAFLAAERAADSTSAFGLLTAGDQQSVGSATAWSDGRADRPVPVTFDVTAEQPRPEGDDVTVAVTRAPSLDPFAGFVSGRAMQVWRAVPEDGTWRVQAEPVSETPVLPPAAGASQPVDQWVQALASCDPTRARSVQAGPVVYGSLDLVSVPCRERGAWHAGIPITLDRAADVQPLVEAYGPDVGDWARLVPAHGPRSHFLVAVAPLGDVWRVIGVTSDGG